MSSMKFARQNEGQAFVIFHAKTLLLRKILSMIIDKKKKIQN